jgi:hypothetical protein
MSDHKDPLGVVSHKQDEADPEGVVQVPNYLSNLLVFLHHLTTDHNHVTVKEIVTKTIQYLATSRSESQKWAPPLEG